MMVSLLVEPVVLPSRRGERKSFWGARVDRKLRAGSVVSRGKGARRSDPVNVFGAASSGRR
jgi:hypothetical protein